jgi:hypothetical protein
LFCHSITMVRRIYSVPAQVNGHPLQLMLDTGCGHSDLWKQAMPGVAEMDKTLLRGTNASGKEYNFGSFRARDLKLGNLTLSNVAMAVDDGLVGHKTISGFLGGNILENFVVTVRLSKISRSFLASSFDLKIDLRMQLSCRCGYAIINLIVVSGSDEKIRGYGTNGYRLSF